MSKEIVDAVKALEQEKGISADKLMDALEDALPRAVPERDASQPNDAHVQPSAARKAARLERMTER